MIPIRTPWRVIAALSLVGAVVGCTSAFVARATDLAAAVRSLGATGFGLLPIGAAIDVHEAGPASGRSLQPPGELTPVRVGLALARVRGR